MGCCSSCWFAVGFDSCLCLLLAIRILACCLKQLLVLCGVVISCGLLTSLGWLLVVCCEVGLVVAADSVLLLFAWIVVNSVDFRSSFFVCFGMCLLIVVLEMLGFTVCMGYLFAITYYVVVCGWLLVCVGFVICVWCF